jgi:hypothetical protein
MIRIFSFLSILIACALCFFAGYKVGKSPASPNPLPSAPSASKPLKPITVEQLPQTVAPEPIVTETVEVESTTEPITDKMAERAQKDMQTFVDQNDRELVAQILEVKEDSLKVRRQIDGQLLELPVNMLSLKDQRFADYLWTQQQLQSKQTAPARTPSQAPEDLMWEALFKD